MGSGEKTYVFNEPNGSRNGIDLLGMVNLGNNGYGNNGMWGQDGIWAILLLALFGRGGFGGFGGNGGQIPEILSGDAGRELLMSAIQGNGNAISQLATTLNCDVNAIRTSIEGIDRSICQVGNQVGMSSLQVINAIQSGNASLANEIAQCCCTTQNAILTQGYENRLADCQQTNTLVNAMNANTLSINTKLDEQNTQRLYDKIDALREEKSNLKFEVSQRNQNEYIGGLFNNISSRLSAIECRQLPTYPQTYVPGFPTATFAAPLCGGYGAFGAGYAAGEAAV